MLTKEEKRIIKEIGKLIKMHRRLKGVSQSELADKMRMKQALLSVYENGKVCMNAVHLLKLEKILKVNFMDYLSNAMLDASIESRDI